MKLNAFQRDYGEPFSDWESEYRELQTEAQEVEARLVEINQRLENLAAVAAAATGRIHELSDEKSGLDKELRAIRFDSGEEAPSTDGIMLEQARSRYPT